jgi:hypothetical protein
MAINIPPPPTNSPQGDRVWTDWYIKLNQILSSTAGISWALVDKTGSNLSDLASRPHSQLQSVLGTGVLHISVAEALALANLEPVASALASWGAITRAAGFDTFAATPSSSNLKTLVTDETGSGALVFATSPTLVTPVLGTPSSGTLTSCTGLPLTTGVTGTLGITNGGTGNSSDAWSTWTPTISAGSGTITTSSTSWARYYQIGKIVFFNVSVTVSNNGTGAGRLRITPPVTPNASVRQPVSAFHITSLIGLSSYLEGSSGEIVVRRLDGTYPITGVPQSVEVSGTYEAA